MMYDIAMLEGMHALSPESRTESIMLLFRQMYIPSENADYFSI